MYILLPGFPDCISYSTIAGKLIVATATSIVKVWVKDEPEKPSHLLEAIQPQPPRCTVFEQSKFCSAYCECAIWVCISPCESTGVHIVNAISNISVCKHRSAYCECDIWVCISQCVIVKSLSGCAYWHVKAQECILWVFGPSCDCRCFQPYSTHGSIFRGISKANFGWRGPSQTSAITSQFKYLFSAVVKKTYWIHVENAAVKTHMTIISDHTATIISAFFLDFNPSVASLPARSSTHPGCYLPPNHSCYNTLDYTAYCNIWLWT